MGDMIKGDYTAQPTATQLGHVARSLRAALPSITQYLGESQLPAARYQLATEKAIAPQEQALNAGLYSQYNPQYAQGGSQADLTALQGAGGQSVLAANQLQRQIDPEYYASMQASSDKLRQLLGGMDPNQLTGAERENVARGLARSNYNTGELQVPTGGGAIGAALTYGNALNQKRQGVANAINTATAALPQFRSGVNTFEQGTSGARIGQNVFSQGGGNQFLGTSPQIGQQQGLAGLAAGTAAETNTQNLLANRRTLFDAGNQTHSAIVGSLPSCCFIFLQALNGKLPWYIRVCRDYHYRKEPLVAKGYIRMSRWLVPLMQKNRKLSWMVNNIMIKPLDKHGRWLVGLSDKCSWWTRTVKWAWFRYWKLTA